MPRSWSSISVVALLALGAACRPPARAGDSDIERLSGCFRRLYGDGPPGSGAGRVWYTLTTDAGVTMMLDVTPSVLASAGGPTLLDGARVRVVGAPSRDSSNARVRTVLVREIRREPAGSGASC